MMPQKLHAVYGDVPRELAETPPDSVQCSPRVPGCTHLLSQMTPESCAGFVMYAPASTIERRHELALALRALVPGGELLAMAPNSKGGNRLAGELTAFGCDIVSAPRRHHQIVRTVRPQTPAGLDAAIAAGAPQRLPGLDLWTQPGVFSWDRIDPGSTLLIANLPALQGRGADLGCGIGILARAAFQAAADRPHAPITHMTLVDLDARALELAKRNLAGFKVATLWADARIATNLPSGLDFVVMNPPFHDGGDEDKALGQAFIERAAAMLRPEGQMWLTANRHLPYEATLRARFGEVDAIADAGGYKIYTARKPVAAARSKRKTSAG